MRLRVYTPDRSRWGKWVGSWQGCRRWMEWPRLTGWGPRVVDKEHLGNGWNSSGQGLSWKAGLPFVQELLRWRSRFYEGAVRQPTRSLMSMEWAE